MSEDATQTNWGYARNPAVFAEGLPERLAADSDAARWSGHVGYIACWTYSGKETCFHYWYPDRAFVGVGRRHPDWEKHRLAEDWSGAANELFYVSTLSPEERAEFDAEVDRLFALILEKVGTMTERRHTVNPAVELQKAQDGVTSLQQIAKGLERRIAEEEAVIRGLQYLIRRDEPKVATPCY